MAFTDSTTYNGKYAEGFYSAALLTGDTKSIIKPFVNVKSKILVGRTDLSGILQDADCTYTDGGDTTLSQKTLEVCAIKVNKTFCQRTFEANYLSEQLKAGSNSDASIVPDNFAQYILDLMAKNISADLENILWNGNTGSTNSTLALCQGFLNKFDNDASVVGLTSSSSLTAGNINTVMQTVYTNIPAAVLDSPDLRIFVGTSTKQLMMIAASTNNQNMGTGFFFGKEELSYFGIPVVVSKRIPADRIVVADLNNLWFGTDLMSDFEDILILPQKSVTGAPETRFVAEFKFGVNYGVSQEIVSWRKV